MVIGNGQAEVKLGGERWHIHTTILKYHKHRSLICYFPYLLLLLISEVCVFSDFALKMYNKVVAAGAHNIIFSPYSISAALAMTSSGAQGDTLSEMYKVSLKPRSSQTRLVRPLIISCFRLVCWGPEKP